MLHEGPWKWVIGGVLAIAGAAPADTPFALSRVGLGPVAQRIAHEDCRLLIIGDSNSIKSGPNSTVGGVCRTWKPDHFVGRVSPGTVSSNEGIRIMTSATGLNVIPRAVYHVGNADPHIWSNGQDGFIPNRAMDMISTGTGLASVAHYCVCELTRLDEYPGGDWTLGGTLKARLIFAHDQSGFSQLRYRARRDTQNGPYVNFTPHDEADRAWIDWVDADVPDGTGTVTTQVRTPADWTSSGQGGPSPCPENCTPGHSLFHAAQMIWRTDVEGLQVDSIAEGGFTVADHLTGASHYDDDALRLYLAATRSPNCFMLLLGQNMTVAQLMDIEGLWRDQVLELINRYRNTSLDVDPDGDPLFLLVSPWSTNDDSGRFHRMALVLADIAEIHPDIGFVNLHLTAGAHRYLNGETLPDGVHYGDDEAANLLTGLIWEQIQRELDGAADLVIQSDSQDLSNLRLASDTIVHIASGTHTGPIAVDGIDVEIRGWDESTCGLSGTTDGPAVQVAASGTVQACRLHLQPGAGALDADGGRAGACVHVNESSMHLRNVDLLGGTTARGGAIALRQATFTATDCYLHQGTAALSGGLIDAEHSSLHLTSTLLEHGDAADGGGVHALAGTILLQTSTISNCVADAGGGALLNSTSGSIEESMIQYNQAETGSGLLLDDAPIEVAGTVLCSNEGQDIVGAYVNQGDNIIGGTCGCPGDLDENEVTEINDLLLVLSFWGNDDGNGDIDGDGVTNVTDLLIVIDTWGPCP